MLSTSTLQLLGSFDKVDRRVRAEQIYMGCIPAILTAPVAASFPQQWLLHDFDKSIEAHWKKLDSEQRTALYNLHESAVVAAKPDYATRRRMLVEHFEKFGYKAPVSILRPQPASQPIQTVNTTQSPVKKSSSATKRTSPEETTSTREARPHPILVVAPSVSRPTRVIYEVMDVRLDKATKNPMISVRYNAGRDTDWIYSSQVLDTESEAALRQVMLKLK